MGEELQFPQGFVWGTATAAYQVEGAVDEDGRGPTIWDVFSATPGKVLGGDTGARACDHYHRWPEDLDLMVELGLPAYRSSLSWARIIPDGDGPVNRAGLDHYSRVLDGLLERGITPAVTLYHWDLPQALQDKGGWTSRATVEAFARYAGVVAEAYGDRVPMWITLNEPWVSAFQGYGTGEHAPGLQDGRAALLAAHHLLMAHGRAARVLASQPGQVGVTLDLFDVLPVSETPEDAAAAQRMFANSNLWFLNPILRGEYPGLLVDWYGETFDGVVQDGDLAVVKAPLDFLGVNYYSRIHAVAGEADSEQRMRPSLDAHEVVPAGLPTTAMGWPVEPDGFRALLARITAEYPELPPLYITENGAAYDDIPEPDGTVNDDDRIAFLDGHLRALQEAIDAGVDVRGYFCWSFLDNFEWAWGYGKRFGLVRVDYDTFRRTPKASARWYADVVRRNALPVAAPPALHE